MRLIKSKRLFKKTALSHKISPCRTVSILCHGVYCAEWAQNLFNYIIVGCEWESAKTRAYAFFKWKETKKWFSCCFAFSLRCVLAHGTMSMNKWTVGRWRKEFSCCECASVVFMCSVCYWKSTLNRKKRRAKHQPTNERMNGGKRERNASAALLCFVLIIILIQTTWTESALNFVYRQIMSTKACN